MFLYVLLLIIALIGLYLFRGRLFAAYNPAAAQFNFTFTGMLLVIVYRFLLYNNPQWHESVEYTCFHFLANVLVLQVFLVVPMFLLLLKDDPENDFLTYNRKVLYVVVSILGGMLAYHFDNILLGINVLSSAEERGSASSDHLLSIFSWCVIIFVMHFKVYFDLVIKRRIDDEFSK